ncbi:methyltransferase domain-containing protein [Egibacter rhizosphaerae]|uniref:Methyltransferase domain-containing protein n=1 Tax=Egibacter rhizosphaerae TaxID=1670831 RepID=A0A411YG99_9ACTN|nr:class I SAM-dependent methyltransferase [Egibacter rhizosphaerae]QBI20294.1 methyltransferase domain-containing protein [Egibacter rhizosphaerae]
MITATRSASATSRDGEVAASGCPGCGAEALEPVWTVRGVPVHCSQLFDSPHAARTAARGDLSLAYCSTCGLMSNTSFDPGLVEYGDDYEDAQAHSPRWVAWARDLVADLVARYGLHGRRALEVGCGRGDFLALLAEAGLTGIGFDPAHRPGPLVAPVADQLVFHRREYRAADGRQGAALVACRHTLEHVANAANFAAMLREGVGRRFDTLLLIEVPDATRILEEHAFWDVYYEHCAYYTPEVLTGLFTRAGFVVFDAYRSFDDQYVILEARPAAHDDRWGSRPKAPPAMAEAVDRFRDAVPSRVRDLREAVEAMEGPVVLWGAGSKAVGYLTVLGLQTEVSAIVDINPVKQGRYLAGTGHPIVRPAELRALRPGTVVLMNEAYRGEITADLAALDLTTKVVTP